MRYDHEKVLEFLFMSGDGELWMVLDKEKLFKVDTTVDTFLIESASISHDTIRVRYDRLVREHAKTYWSNICKHKVGLSSDSYFLKCYTINSVTGFNMKLS